MAQGSANPVKTPTSILSVLLPKDAITLDAPAFDDLIHNVGVRMVHFRAIKCPIGMQDENDERRSGHDDHSGCSNGFLYRPIGRVTVMFTSNSSDPHKLDEGFFDGSTVAVTFPRFYDSDPNKRVMVRAFDRFYLEEGEDNPQEEITTAIWDVTHRRSDGKPDRMEFPIVRAEHVIDSAGNWYKQGYDFDLGPHGSLVWRANHGPVEGTVYTCWYEYVPFWYCQKLIHEIRVTPSPNYMDASKVTTRRMSYGAVLSREYVFRNQESDSKAPDNGGRKQMAPDKPEPQEYP